MEIISKKFKFISKNKNTNKYEILEEYESSLFRFVKKLFCNNLERCRKEFSVDLMFLHLFYYGSTQFFTRGIEIEDSRENNEDYYVDQELGGETIGKYKQETNKSSRKADKNFSRLSKY